MVHGQVREDLSVVRLLVHHVVFTSAQPLLLRTCCGTVSGPGMRKAATCRQRSAFRDYAVTSAVVQACTDALLDRHCVAYIADAQAHGWLGLDFVRLC